MIPGKVRSKTEHIYHSEKINLLKFAAVYGANASGKSNLVRAMNFMQSVVIHGRLPVGSMELYCRTRMENSEKPSYFEVEILLGEKCYSYGFEVLLKTGDFVSEWLYEIGAESEKKLFEHNIEKKSIQFGTVLAGIKALNSFADMVRGDPSVLFLNEMNRKKANFYKENPSAEVLKNIYDWFHEKLDINYPEKPISDFSYLQNPKQIETVCNLLQEFDTGITKIELVPIPVEKITAALPEQVQKDLQSQIEVRQKLLENMKNDKNKHLQIDGFSVLIRSEHEFFTLNIDKENKVTGKTLKFSHGNQSSLFSFKEESDGTVRILDLIEMLVSNQQGKTYIIDELDRRLHPCLTYRYVQEFLQTAAKNDIQLIVTTHESRLLDFDLLRRDEVWFINKRKTGESDMYSLEEYNERFDKRIDKAYLEGRYGGVPVFTTLFPV
jgi:AAA15 family ATPase/GTPase